jgi:hypothetical protein
VIPILLFAGFLAGAAARLRSAAVVGAVVSLAWGVQVGVTDGGAAVSVVGVLLAVANFAVGWLVGAGWRHALERVWAVVYRSTRRPRTERS